jgi:hypothetical protein
MITVEFVTGFQSFVNATQEMINEHYQSSFPNNTVPKIEYEEGKKYIRVISNSGLHNRSVFCFVDKTTGDVYKAASWKVPAKHVRGNIFRGNIKEYLTPYGAQYLR